MIDQIKYCKIHPALGIARLGNSRTEYYIGPEAPGVAPEPHDGRFKDLTGAIKRQAARFRIYAYGLNQNGEEVALGELTAVDADIVWSAHLANKKPYNKEFRGRYYEAEAPLRNQQLKDAGDARQVLIIDGKPKTIVGVDQASEPFVGSFGPLPLVKPAQSSSGNAPVAGELGYSKVVSVELGELRTDHKGRLLVLGGFGHSATVWDNPIGSIPAYPADDQYYYANNDYWYDDTSDGPITATVTLKNGGANIPVHSSAWVLVAPPKYTPSHEAITTLWDTALEAAQKYFPDRAPKKQAVSFTHDVYPILARVDALQWLSAYSYRGHGKQTRGSFVEAPLLMLLASNSKSDDAVVQARRHVFGRLRNPRHAPYNLVHFTTKDPWNPAHYPEATQQANMTFMPQLSGDNGDAVTGDPTTWDTVLESQYDVLEAWANGDFLADWPGVPPEPKRLAELDIALRPEALDKGALLACVGGPFYPGIEMTYIATHRETWAAPFRIDPANHGPGDITKHMALPWQSDFYECNLNWWPSARPDDIVTSAEYESVLANFDHEFDGGLARALGSRVLWARGLPEPTSPTADPAGDNMMITAWSKLGFVVKKRSASGEHAYVETERSPYACLTERDYFYYLMNIDAYPDFLPFCRTLVEGYLATARDTANTAGLEVENGPLWNYFEYTADAFNARMNAIYEVLVAENNDPATYATNLQMTRDDVIYRLLQNAPFNQLDGAWLRGVTEPGPIDEVNNLLFRIYMDEYGDGIVERQHCNVYTDVLKSVNIYLPELFTRDYAQDSRFLDSAFTQPVFLLAISALSQDYLPEILGMTLYLEWSSIGLPPIKAKLEAFNIDPIYYTLHIGIDNAAAGHGALAKRAVMLFLDQIRERQGEAEMQRCWDRIWTGYVAFGTLGTLDEDIKNVIKHRPTLLARLLALIVEKKPYGSQNHLSKKLGPTQINDWFEDPPGFLQELVRSSMVVPGRPEVSPLLQLMSFNGPMFHVFTADEQSLWRQWILADCPLQDPDPEDPQRPERIGTSANMFKVVAAMAQRQMGVSGHHVRLLGPDPDKSSIDDPGSWVSEPIKHWFDQIAIAMNGLVDSTTETSKPDWESAKKWSTAFMAALRHEPNGWIVRTNPAISPLITSLLAGSGAMASAMQDLVPWSDPAHPMSYKEVIVDWILNDCPLSDPPKLTAAVSIAKARPRKRVLGMGKVH